MLKKIAEVVVEQFVGKSLDYRIPETLVDKVSEGMQVVVPLRKKLTRGIVLALKEHSSFAKLQDVVELDQEVQLNGELLELAKWMSRYYGVGFREIYKTFLPTAVRQQKEEKKSAYARLDIDNEKAKQEISLISKKSPKGASLLQALLLYPNGVLVAQLLHQCQASHSSLKPLVEKGWVVVEHKKPEVALPEGVEFFLSMEKKLTSEQEGAVGTIKKSLDQGKFATHLLHGVTGSGKTEVYLKLIQEALKQGKSALFLVPEISLTSQLYERLSTRLKAPLALLHHRNASGERMRLWRQLQNGEIRVAMGPRSALFAPLKDIGLIIVDEEHESAYKQNEAAPCYHARDCAVMRGFFSQATVVLGSATPSLETLHNVEKGKYQLSRLDARAEGSQLPEITLVDMRRYQTPEKSFTLFSDPLLKGIRERMERGEQTLLFLNRRGYHSSVTCQDCQECIRCPECDIALTLHKNEELLLCHLCHYSLPVPKNCPSCDSSSLFKFKGVGTELVEKSLHAIFPEIRTSRVDADTTRRKGSHDQLLKEFGRGKADVLIGTQMIAKGLHFPQVTLVGILNSDSALHIPDFRAAENTFQLITQVAGRAGRGRSKGQVLIQTWMPDNTTLKQVAAGDFEGFVTEELASRKLFGYPPYNHLLKCRLAGKVEKTTFDKLNTFRSELLQLVPTDIELYPVTPAGYAKVRGEYFFEFLIKSASVMELVKTINELKQRFPRERIELDVDPLN